MSNLFALLLAIGLCASAYAGECDSTDDAEKAARVHMAKYGDVQQTYLGEVEYIKGGGRGDQFGRFEIPYVNTFKSPDVARGPVVIAGKIVVWRANCEIDKLESKFLYNKGVKESAQ